MANSPALTHEGYLQSIRTAAVRSALSRGALTPDEASRLSAVKLVYGVGRSGVRGACFYGTWVHGAQRVDTVEISAAAQESWVQLAGTAIHELAHVLAGHEAGHGAAWRRAAVALGFTKGPGAAGQRYCLALFRPDIRAEAHTLAQRVADGMPAFAAGRDSWLTLLPIASGRPCSAGTGTRGGTSRGPGSGSRLRLWECRCPRPVKVRVASDTFAAHCDECGEAFTRRYPA